MFTAIIFAYHCTIKRRGSINQRFNRNPIFNQTDYKEHDLISINKKFQNAKQSIPQSKATHIVNHLNNETKPQSAKHKCKFQRRLQTT